MIKLSSFKILLLSLSAALVLGAVLVLGPYVTYPAANQLITSCEPETGRIVLRSYDSRRILRGEGISLTLENGVTIERVETQPIWIVGEGWKTWRDSPVSFVTSHSILFLQDGSVSPVRIAAVSPSDPLEYLTYVNVAGTHSYFHEGVLVHNCSYDYSLPGSPKIDCHSSSCSSSSDYGKEPTDEGGGEDPDPCSVCHKDRCECGEKRAENAATGSEAAAEAEAVVAAAETAQTAAADNVTSTGEANSAVAAGDPVLTSSGMYVMTEQDLVVKRTYRSGSSSSGLSSGGWFYSTDTRLLRGIDLGASTLTTTLQEKLATVNRAVSEYHRYEGSDETEDGIKLLAAQSSAKALYDASLKRSQRAALLAAINNKYSLHGIDSALQYTGNDTLVWIDDSGSPVIFEPEPDATGRWWPKDESRKGISIISINGKNSVEASGFQIADRNGVTREYNAWGLLVSIQEIGGEKQTFACNASTGRVTAVANAHGAKWNLAYTINDDLSSISGPFGQSVAYAYTAAAAGRVLSSVTDSDGDTVGYAYDDRGRLTSIKKPDALTPGDSSVELTYGVSNDGGDLVTATRHEEGKSETFSYFPAESRTRYTNHIGLVTDYYYDANHRPVKEIYPDGMVTEYVYDGTSGLVSKEYRYHKSALRPSVPFAEYSYDSLRYNRIKAVYADYSYESWSWNSFDQITSYRDRDGAVTIRVYDGRGNLTEEHQAINGINTITYKATYDTVTGRLASAQKANQVKWEYEYNAATGYPARRSAMLDGKKITESWNYDILGRLVTFTDGENRVTSYAYNPKTAAPGSSDTDSAEPESAYLRFRNVVVTTPEKLTKTFYYNGRKDLVRTVEKDLLTGKERSTRIQYDRRHLPVSIIDGTGNTTTFTYRADGKILAETRGLWSTVYEYHKTTGELTSVIKRKETGKDDSGKPVYQTSAINYSSARTGSGNLVRTEYSPNPDTTGTAALQVSNVYTYDSWDRVIAVKNPANDDSSRVLTPAGRLRAEQASSGGWFGYSYSSEGALSGTGRVSSSAFSSIADPVSVLYHGDGTVKQKTDRENTVTTYEYDGRGLLTKEGTSSGEKRWQYDKAGRIIRSSVSTLPAGSLSAAAPGNAAETFKTWTYNDSARTVTVSEGGLYTSVWRMDAWGNPVEKSDSLGNSSFLEYDGAGRLVTEKNPYGGETAYEWNALGKLNKITRPDLSFESYEYDQAGNVTKVSDNLGIKWAGTYNRAGLLSSETGRPGISKSYTYDTLGRLISVSTGGVETEHYSYENRGTVIHYSSGTTDQYTYEKNAWGELVSETNRLLAEKQYTYDDEGQLTTVTDFSEIDTETITDPVTLTTTVKRNGTLVSSIVKDYSGRIIAASSAAGTIRFAYDAGGSIIKQVDAEAGETTVWSYDSDGRRIGMKSGNRDVRYSYGKAGELLSVTDTLKRLSVSYTYDSMLRESGRRYGNGVTQKTSRDAIGRTVMIREYSGSGQLLRGEAYLYDSMGRRSHTVNESGAVTKYEYDSQSRLSTILYPSLPALRQASHEEAVNAGIYLSQNSGAASTYSYSMDEYGKLRVLLDSMSPLRSNVLKPTASVWKESYTYDSRGNRIAKTTPWGTINYRYDAENRMTRAGSTEYAYDANGNLFSEIGLRKSATYTYNAFNRMETSTIITTETRTKTVSRYGYDALNRRTLFRDAGGTLLRTLYDGASFEVIRESAAFDNGSLTSSFGSQTQSFSSVSTGSSLGASTSTGRYLWIDDDNAARTVGSASGELASLSIPVRYTGERTPLYARGEAIGTARETTASTRGGTAYFGTDLLGSARSVTDNYGSLETSFEYDAFGTPYQGDFVSGLSTGYTGKSWDPVTGLYDYGYRDYSPSIARFTTPDPIRDGRNWFSYVNNDPVNFVDPWGLTASDAGAAFTALGGGNEYQQEQFGMKPNIPSERNFSADARAMESIASVVNENDAYRKVSHNHLGEQYNSGINDCDIWVQNRSSEVGTDIKDEWGDAVTNTVASHMKKLGSKVVNKPDPGANIFFQNDGHTGLILVDPDGSVDVYHQGYNGPAAGWNSAKKEYSSVSQFENAWSGTKTYWPQ